MVWERPRRFRMTGGVSRMTGTEFDLGSNDELFWMATRHGPSPTLYYARHDEFAVQMDRQILPVSPEWLVEAMGIVELDPGTLLGTPRTGADGLVEIESTVASPLALIVERSRSILNMGSFGNWFFAIQPVDSSHHPFFRITSTTRRFRHRSLTRRKSSSRADRWSTDEHGDRNRILHRE